MLLISKIGSSLLEAVAVSLATSSVYVCIVGSIVGSTGEVNGYIKG